MSARDERHAVAPYRGYAQAPITEAALVSGLAVLAQALARRHPGRRFIFECTPRDNHAELVADGQTRDSLPAPQDAHAALVDRHRPQPAEATRRHT